MGITQKNEPRDDCKENGKWERRGDSKGWKGKDGTGEGKGGGHGHISHGSRTRV
jgi:hypothetical protein